MAASTGESSIRTEWRAEPVDAAKPSKRRFSKTAVLRGCALKAVRQTPMPAWSGDVLAAPSEETDHAPPPLYRLTCPECSGASWVG
jgi:hypothetical protein